MRNPHCDLNRPDVEIALDEPTDDARCQLPKLGGGGAVGSGDQESAVVFADDLGVAGQVPREERG
jgi:hypothetical protein